MGQHHLENHASYLDHWVKALKEDSRYIFQSAAGAQKAIDFIGQAKSENVKAA